MRRCFEARNIQNMAESAAKAAKVDLPVKKGEVIGGKYRLEEVLGLGGTAVVMSATHQQLQQKVAVKLLLNNAATAGVDAERLLREAQVIAQMRSPHVARVVDVGTLSNGSPFMVMELLEGIDLEGHLQLRGRLAIAEAVDIVMQVCEAVAEAHGLGVVHRDLKPGNVFITRDVDKRPLVKVLDFGLSKLSIRAKQQAQKKITSPLEVMGTPAYMSPEQLRATSDVDERSDIWSLGVLLYELCTGELPFDDESVQALCVKVMRDPFKPISVDLPPGLETIISRCLQKDPEHRFPKVSALAISLAPFAEKKERLDRVLRVQPLSLPPDNLTRPEEVPPYRPPGAPTQAAVVTDTSIRFEDDDEDPFRRKRGGWSLFGFGVAGALAGAAILIGVAMYAGKAAETPAASTTPPPSAEPTPAPTASATPPPSEDPAAANANLGNATATKPSVLGPPGKRSGTLAGGRQPASAPRASASAATTGAAAPKPVDPDKLLETR
jgi:serine/threonine protein kinase